MPRKTKEIVVPNDKELKEEKTKKTSKKETKKTTTKKTTAKKTTVKKAADKKVTPTKKSSSTKTSKVSKKSTNTKTTKKGEKKVEVAPIIEYYDLPYRYNQTVVKLLAQTPNSLFVYWDISDSDRENYVKTYGEDFFNTTRPVLKIYNDTLNYIFEVEINDFANCWYIGVNDANCVYRAELGRKPVYNSSIKDNYIHITNSNKIDSPNDHVLFEKITPDFNFKFKNVKNNQVTYKNISNDKNRFVTITQLYSNIYEKQNVEELNRISNPSSNFSSRN